MVEVDGLIPPELVAELAKSAKMVRGRSSLFRICLKWWAAEPLLPAQLVDRVARRRSGVLMIGLMAELLVQRYRW